MTQLSEGPTVMENFSSLELDVQLNQKNTAVNRGSLVRYATQTIGVFG